MHLEGSDPSKVSNDCNASHMLILDVSVEVQQGKKWLAAKHADQSVKTVYYRNKYLPKHTDQSVRTGVLRHTSYTTYTLMSVPDLQGLSVAKTIRRR